MRRRRCICSSAISNDDIAKATQYVPQTLAALGAGEPVRLPISKPYGCSVKYGAP